MRGPWSVALGAVAALSALLCVAARLPPVWLTVFVCAALLYGSVSPIVAARRLLFLAVEAPHTALLSVTVGVLAHKATGLFNELAWALVLSVAILNAVGHLVRSGVDPDVATAVLVASSTSGSVAALHYVLSHYGAQYNPWSFILGDPLLATAEEAVELALITAVTAPVTVALYKVSVYAGADPDHTKLSVGGLWLYDAMLYTVLALSSVALLRVVGFILEHVLLTLPAVVAMSVASSAGEALAVSALSSISASLLGLALSKWLDAPPASAVGLFMLALYVISRAWAGRRHA